jgi:hypothetical protein
LDVLIDLPGRVNLFPLVSHLGEYYYWLDLLVGAFLLEKQAIK